MANATKVDVTTAFNAGEFTPALAGRIDFQDYKYSARFIENFLPEVQGGLKKFYGTRKIAVINKPDDYVLVPFDALDDTVVLVIHDGVVSVIDGADYYDTTLTVTVAGLKELRWTQQNAVMYFVHPTCLPFTIRCYGRDPDNDNKLIFRIEEIEFKDVPYFPVGWSGNFNGTITTNKESGTIQVTAGSTATLSLKIPDVVSGTSGAVNVLRGPAVATLLRKYGGTNYTVTFGATKVQLIRKRNGVQSVVSEVNTGVQQTVKGFKD